MPVAYWILKVVLSPVFFLLWRVKVEGVSTSRPRAGRAGRQPPVVLRLLLPPPGAAAPGDLRGQGRVLRQLADGLVLPGRRPDPHEPRAAATPPSGPSTRPPRSSTPAGLLGIYPEGTRAPDPRLHKGHTGVARLSLRCDVPIIPVGIVGTRAVQPPGSRLMRPFHAGDHPVRAAGDLPCTPARRSPTGEIAGDGQPDRSAVRRADGADAAAS